jgi:hypothetical protein
MSERLDHDERLIEALRLSGDPPRAWMEAAALIPLTLGDLASIERVVASEEFRSHFRESPESAMADAGLPATPALIAALRAQFA